MAASRTIAAIMGPTLAAVAASEALNLAILGVAGLALTGLGWRREAG